MIQIENECLRLAVTEDGATVVLQDKRRRCTWRLDNSRRHYRPAAEQPSDALRYGPSRPLPPGDVSRGDNRITIRHAFGGNAVRYDWIVHQDHVEVRLTCDVPDIVCVALPGAMLPEDGPREIAVPLYQGLVIRGASSPWERSVSHGGHEQFSMAMAATINDRAALLATHDSPANWMATYGQNEHGPFVFFEQQYCAVDGWTGATVRLYPCDAAVTSICKTYRRIVQARGDFVSWQEKIAAKPMLKDLFGAVMAFVGYNKTGEIDYLASTQKLKSYGFDSIYMYPLRMCHYSLDFKMGGDDPTWHSNDELAALKAIPGVHPAPWMWVIEGLNDGSQQMQAIYRRKADGELLAGWKIDEQRWFQVCTTCQTVYVRGRLTGDMAAMDWLHFDVNASVPGKACFALDHQGHGGRPMGPLEDMKHVRQLIGPETAGNRVVSSEGFNDYYTSAYDVGTTKMLPPTAGDGDKMPVPMTMLVFHDSCVHDWWEVHNYNDVAGWPICDIPDGLGRRGSGLPRLKAAIDALYGCPPNLFPFGKQYAWVDQPLGRTYSFLIRLEDPSVQEAVAAALPVARLHKRIGPCEMTSFEFLSADRAVQQTTFCDGTRVVANLSDRPQNVPGAGLLPGHSWKELA